MNKYDFLIDSAKEHQKLDEYQRGNIGCVEEDGIFRGCSVACTVYDYEMYIGGDIYDIKYYNFYNHDYLSEILEVPEWVCHLQEAFFENISESKLKTFNVDFLKLLKENHHENMDLVEPKFLLYVVQDAKKSVNKDYTQLLSVMSKAEEALQDWIEKGVPDEEKMNTAEDALKLDAAWATNAEFAAICVEEIVEIVESASWASESYEIAEKSEKYDQFCDKFFELVKDA